MKLRGSICTPRPSLVKETTFDSSLERAYLGIQRYFNSAPQRVYHHANLQQIHRTKLREWRLQKRISPRKFIDFLQGTMLLRRQVFSFPDRWVTRYFHGKASAEELALSFRKGSYLCHATALFFRELRDAPGNVVYVNEEQTPKTVAAAPVNPKVLATVFQRRPRETKRLTVFQGKKIVRLNGKGTGQLGVEEITGPDGLTVRVATITRSLIDAAVRPECSGGPEGVLSAYQAATGQFSIRELVAMLGMLQYVYPIHQRIGFYLEAAGGYSTSDLAVLQEIGFPYDFYLAHGMKDPTYVERWRLFVPTSIARSVRWSCRSKVWGPSDGFRNSDSGPIHVATRKRSYRLPSQTGSPAFSLGHLSANASRARDSSDSTAPSDSPIASAVSAPVKPP